MCSVITVPVMLEESCLLWIVERKEIAIYFSDFKKKCFKSALIYIYLSLDCYLILYERPSPAWHGHAVDPALLLF